MNSSWEKVPLWSLVREARQVVEPNELGSDVVHYSIPAVDEMGTGRIEKSEEIKSAKLRMQGGEVLISKLNPRKSRVVHVQHSGLPIVCSTEFVALRVSHSLDARFLAYLLQSELIRQDLDARVQSVTRSHQRVDPGYITHLLVDTPSPDEQRRVADFLDAETGYIDSLANATSKQASLLDRRIVEAFREITTTGGGPRTCPTGVAWMPTISTSHRLRKIGLVFKTSSGTTPQSSNPSYFDGEHWWINTGDLRDSIISTPGKSVTNKALIDYPTLKIYKPGALVVAMYGATTGRVGLLAMPACVNQACCVLTGLGVVSPEYAFYWFRGHRNEILNLASGGGQPNISQDIIRNLRIPVPTEESVQSEIIQHCRELEEATINQQSLLHRRGDLLAERRQALITAAVTGQFDVSSASGREAADGVV